MLTSVTHSDVTTTTPATGDILYYNGSDWVCLTPPASAPSGTYVVTVEYYMGSVLGLQWIDHTV